MKKIALAILIAPAAGAAELPPAISMMDMAALDRGTGPCADFYQFACGGWLKSHPIPADQSRWGRFNELAERNKLVLKDILERSAASKTQDAVGRRLGGLYAACLDEDAAQKRGIEPLKADFAAIDALASIEGMPALMARLHREGIAAGFGFDSDQDLKDSTKVIGEFDQSGLGLPDRDYYLKTDAKSEKLRQQYVWHVAKTFGLLGETPGSAAAAADTVLSLETALAKVSMDRVARRDPDNLYHKMSEAEMAKAAPGFDWKRYIAETDAPPSPWLNVISTGFAVGFADLLAKEPLADWKIYLRWHVARSAAPWLTKEMVDESFDFNGRKVTGAKELKPRWKRCVELADGLLGHDLGRRYAAENFGDEGRKRTDELIDALQKALKQDLEQLDWMTPTTRARALEKRLAIVNKIGSPAVWRDYQGVNIDRSDLLASVRSARAYEVKRRLAKIGKPVDRSEWEMTPPTVNAYYNAQLNEIVFPAGILQPPFFDRAGDQAANLGGIGMVIGHELTHGFDDEGRKFDAQGNLADWWTAEDAKKFEGKTACVVDQYGLYEPLAGVRLNGKLTLGENTADNGGLRLASMALDELKKGGSIPVDSESFTAEQRLFVGFAQVWCQNSTEESLRLLASVDPHSAARFRVIGPLSNSPEFAKAFSCKPTDAMVRARACRVW